MKTHTIKDDKAQPYFSAKQIYDELMQRIEPDLMSSSLPYLDELYAGESPEQHRMRMEHYAIAFTIFDEAVQKLSAMMSEDIRMWGKNMQQIAKGESAAKDVSAIQSIEQALDSDS